MSNQTLSESESMMAWLDRRIEQTSDPATFAYYQKQFVRMWFNDFTDPVPQEYRDKISEAYRKLLKWE